MTTNSSLSFTHPPASLGKSTAELDLHERSTKKVKDGDQDTAGGTWSVPEGKRISFRDIITGRMDDDMEDDQVEDSNKETVEEGLGDIRVEEMIIGGYECPTFIFFAEEEQRIRRPWRRGVIVKLLGRRIGYKALENRLNQMRVRKGVINIIDLSNDYYLVAFSHEDDKTAAMTNGPWFIYDHYLTVKDWRPNFQPDSDTIDEVAVWVRISGFPIEYYDSRALTVFGKRIGRTIKVDKTTTKQERGKYARICVAVNLSKPLLVMFNIGKRSYKVEYEGLHLLCMSCGRYGHNKEGCYYKEKEREVGSVGGSNGNNIISNDSSSNGNRQLQNGEPDGPWKIVQKNRRGKKVVKGRKNSAPGRVNERGKIGGSRFLALESSDLEMNGVDVALKEGDLEQSLEVNAEIITNSVKLITGNNDALKNIVKGTAGADCVGNSSSGTENVRDGDIVKSLNTLGISNDTNMLGVF
ncbi:uncharacterized protein LOC131597407 [Vicia villosa]|uniref:uncharacterized protein LOC131597407 n=1 Tax=Vicia villosa TaxID=3911 RepID=UPI00273AFBD9|nr:uncharacterized protein LOC131597407 [Vicia villosa]